MSKTFVIVGASLAGAKAAAELRERGFDGRVVLVGAESERPYERPPLTKDYLQGKSERGKAYVHDEDFYGEREIDLRLGAVAESIDPQASTVTLAGGEELAFSLGGTLANAALGPLPGWLVLAAVAAFYGWLGFVATRRYARAGEIAYGTVHV